MPTSVRIPLSPVVYKYVTRTYGDNIRVPDDISPVSTLIQTHLCGKRLSLSEYVVNDTGDWPYLNVEVSDRFSIKNYKFNIGWKDAKALNSILLQFLEAHLFFLWDKTAKEKKQVIIDVLESYDITEEDLDLDNLLRKMRRIKERHMKRSDSLIYTSMDLTLNVKSANKTPR